MSMKVSKCSGNIREMAMKRDVVLVMLHIAFIDNFYYRLNWSDHYRWLELLSLHQEWWLKK